MTERVITFASPICSLRNFSSGSSTQMIAFCTYKQQFTITCKTIQVTQCQTLTTSATVRDVCDMWMLQM